MFTAAGLGAWALAAAVAFIGQTLAVSPHPEEARPWLIAAAVLGFVAVRLIEREDSRRCQSSTSSHHAQADGASAEPVALSRRRCLGGLAMMALGGLYALVATVLLALRQSEGTATWVWLFGLASSLAGAVLLTHGARRMRLPQTTAGWLELGLLLVIVGGAIWLRLPDVAAIPPEVHGDEGAIGLEARRVMDGQLAVVFGIGWNQFPALSFALDAGAMRVFGDNLFGLRMASVIEGVLCVVVFYGLVRRLWASRPALLAAAFLAIAAWHIHFSRTGFLNVQSPLAILLVLYFLVRGVQERRAVDWLACGFAIGLSLEVYYAARLAPVFVALYLGFRLLTERGRFVRAQARGMVIMTFGAAVFVAPMVVVYARDPVTFILHANAAMVANPRNLAHEFDAYHVSTLPEVLAIQAQRTIEAFHIQGETSIEYGHKGPLFDFWTGALLAMGAFAILLRPGSARGLLLAGWVWLSLVLGSVMTTDALYSPRLVLAIPALVLAPALVLESAWHAVTRLTGRIGTYLFALPVAVLLGLALQGNLHDYFDLQVRQRQPAGRFTLLSTYALSIEDSYRLYMIGRPDWTITYETPRFLVVPRPDAVDVRNAPLALPLERIPISKGVAFLVERGADDYAERMDAIRRSYPVGQESLIAQTTGSPVFTSYLVDNRSLLASNPVATRD